VATDDAFLKRGLTTSDVAERVANGQVNRPPRDGFAAYRDIVVRNTLTLFNALVVPAAVALFLLAEYRGAWAVSAMAVINTLIGLVQELRAKRHLDTLALLAEAKARVVRDGEERAIPAGDVVLGDLIRLAAGEPVVADGAVLTATYLEVDEALLTGESDPVPRRVGDRLLSGSACVAGDGCYRADQVGAKAFTHETSALARQYRHAPSPMQRTLDAIIRILTGTAVALCLVYVVLHLTRGFPQTDLWQMVAATVTSMVPQGLVLMTTLAFTLAAVRMSRRGAVVQRLSAVESMAAVEVLCMDKTGTLTTARLSLDRVQVIDGDESDVRAKLRLFAWASVDSWSKAIQALRTALGPLPDGETPDVIDQVPFKSQNRYSVVCLRVAGREQTLVIGAFEALQPLLASPGPAAAAWRDLLPTGLRLLLFAEAASPPVTGSLAGRALRPLALVALSDELRPEAGAVLQALAAQGIRFKILSGDNPETVRATIAHLKLPLAREPVVTGEQLAIHPNLIREAGVFGRVAPKQKLDVVTALQAAGLHVGMIGDGINDILPIKRADLGVAMGAGSGATKTVADLVLENNDFQLLPAALDEGRVLLDNLRRAAKLFLLKNVYTLFLIVFGFGVLGLEFPYLPQQVTLLNWLTIGGPAFLMMFNRTASRRPVRGRFLREVGGFALAAGLATGVVGLAVWFWSARYLSFDPQAQRTLLLTTLILTGLGNLLVVAECQRRIFAWAIAALPVYAAIMYVAPTAYFFALTPLSIGNWGLAVGAAAMALGPCAIAGRYFAQTDR
jgi:cation-transporting ATPase E